MHPSATTENAAPELRFPQFTGPWVESRIGKHTLSSAFGPRFSSDLYSSSGNVATLRTTDMDDNGMICFDRVPLADLDEKLLADHILQAGDLVISRSGTIGVTGIFTGHNVPVVPGAFLIRFRLDPLGISSHFVQHYLNSEKGRRKLNKLAAGGVQKNLKGSSVLEMEVHLATLPEQRKIADFLTAVDGRIQQLSQKKALLEDYKKGVMQQIFTQALRFKDDHGNDFPNWEEKTLGDFCICFSGGTPTSGNRDYYGGSIPFIRSAEIAAETTALFLTEKGLKESAAKMVEVGDLLVALYGANSGEVGISRITGAINQAILCVRTKESVLFLYFWLEFSKQSIVNTYLQGGQGNLSGKIVQALNIEMPSIPEQTKIANFLTALDRKIESVAKQITHTQVFKKGLLQQMFV